MHSNFRLNIGRCAAFIVSRGVLWLVSRSEAATVKGTRTTSPKFGRGRGSTDFGFNAQARRELAEVGAAAGEGCPQWTLKGVPSRKSATRRGFSLVEIMVVIVIIGLLAGVLAVNIRGNMMRAKVSAAKIEIAKLADQLELYLEEVGSYPSQADGLAGLTRPSAETGEPWIKESDLLDPWKNRYEYVIPGPDNEPFDIVCLGADGRTGGTGGKQDISILDIDR